MSGLGMGIAEEEKENGIRVSNLYPGEVNTPILDNRKAPPSQNTAKAYYSLRMLLQLY